MWPLLAPVDAYEGVSTTPLASAYDVDPESREAVLDQDDPPRYREANTARTLADNLVDRWEWTDTS